MNKLITVIIILGIMGLVFVGLWANTMITNNNLQEQISSDNQTIGELQLENLYLKLIANTRYFKDSDELSEWLNQQPAMSSETGNDYYKNALILQKQALKDGFIISVSYSFLEGDIIVTCDVYTETGKVYYFDPEIRNIKMSFNLGVIEPELSTGG